MLRRIAVCHSERSEESLFDKKRNKIAADEARCGPEQTNHHEGTAPDLQISTGTSSIVSTYPYG